MYIHKGILGLKQAGRITKEFLELHLAKFGYAPFARTSSLWKHSTKDITFSLVVDYFRVKYVGKENSDHLIQALKNLYTISIDCNGALCCGIIIAWDYRLRICNIMMPHYLIEALQKFQHPTPQRRQDDPHAWKQPVYVAALQYSDNPYQSALLPTKSINLVQQIIGTLFYYSIAVDPTMLVALGSIAAHNSKAPDNTYNEVLWLLNYTASHPDATIRYTASDMVLHVHSGASYLSEPKFHSRAGGHYFLRDRSPQPNHPPQNLPIDQWPHLHCVQNHEQYHAFGS